MIPTLFLLPSFLKTGTTMIALVQSSYAYYVYIFYLFVCKCLSSCKPFYFIASVFLFSKANSQSRSELSLIHLNQFFFLTFREIFVLNNNKITYIFILLSFSNSTLGFILFCIYNVSPFFSSVNPYLPRLSLLSLCRLKMCLLPLTKLPRCALLCR